MSKKLNILSFMMLVVLASCKKDTKSSQPTPAAPAPQLKFVFKFDSTQTRLDGFGNVSVLPANHRAQSPKFNGMSVHYLELTPTKYTPVSAGTVLYVTPTVASPNPVVATSGTTTTTYTDAIEFSKESIVGDGGTLFSIPLSQVNPGTYEYLRISVAYQNYDIKYAIKSGTTAGGYTFPSNYYSNGTIASFIGYNTFVNSYKIKDQTVTVGTNKPQGYWGFESAPFVFGGTTYTVAPSTGQSPSGSTTVVNPLFQTSAVPPGSCLVTGQFVSPSSGNPTGTLTITGHETSDIVVTVSMSTNNSFEWKYNPSNPNDGYIYTLNGDTVVDMGVRGMKPILPQ